MHCPRCGTSAGASRAYCRACGLSLERIAELIGEALALQEDPKGELARLRELRSKHEKWGSLAGFVTFGLILLLFLEIFFTPIILKGGILPLLGVLLILSAIGAGGMVYFQISAKSLKEKIARPLLPPNPALSLDASNLRAPDSITERTTELLTESKGRSTREIA